MSSEEINHNLNSPIPKHFLTTTVKLNSANYLLWAQFFRLFFGSQKKLKHLSEDPPAKSTTAYDDWVATDCSVMTWLLSSMDNKISASVIFLKIAKKI